MFFKVIIILDILVVLPDNLSNMMPLRLQTLLYPARLIVFFYYIRYLVAGNIIKQN